LKEKNRIFIHFYTFFAVIQIQDLNTYESNQRYSEHDTAPTASAPNAHNILYSREILRNGIICNSFLLFSFTIRIIITEENNGPSVGFALQ
jgi:hypothetical protein